MQVAYLPGAHDVGQGELINGVPAHESLTNGLLQGFAFVEGVRPILLGQRGLGTHASHEEDGIHLSRGKPQSVRGRVGSFVRGDSSI